MSKLQPPAAPPAAPARGWVSFWFTPADPVGLHVLRLLAGLLFLAWLLPFAGHVDALFGLQGWFDRQAYADAGRLVRPGEEPFEFGWSLLYLFGDNPTLLAVAYWAAVAVVALFTLGVAPRLTAVLTWVVVASFTANPVIEAEGDALLQILALYLMLGYLFLNQRTPGLSWSARLFGCGEARLTRDGRRSLAANLALRLLQVHFAVVIVASGLHKLQFGDWWAGVALWFPLYPPFATTLGQARAHAGDRVVYLWMLNLAAYAALGWQLGFPLFAWRRGWRLVLVGGAAVGWLATAFVYQIPVFGPALFLGCLSFLTADEWHRVLGWAARLPGLHWLAHRLPAPPDEAPPFGVKKAAFPTPVAVSHR